MKIRSLILTAAALVTTTFLLSGCSNTKVAAADEQAVTLRYAYASNSQPVVDSMKEFGRLVKEKTNRILSRCTIRRRNRTDRIDANWSNRFYQGQRFGLRKLFEGLLDLWYSIPV